MQEQEVHLRDYFDVLIRRRTILLFTFAVIFLGVVLYTFLVRPVYEASSTLYLSEDKPKGLLGDIELLSSSESIDAEIEIVKSRTIAEEIVRKYHLNWLISKKPGTLSFKVAEFTSSAADPEYSVEFSGNGTYRVRNSKEKIAGDGREGEILKGSDFSLLITDLEGKRGDTFTLELLPFNKTVSDVVIKHLDAAETKKGTNVMRISYQDTDPERARNIVNTVVAKYLDRKIAFKSEEAAKTVEFVEDQLRTVKNELDTAERNLRDYKSTSGVIALDNEAQAMIQTIADTEKARAETGVAKKQIEFAIAGLKDAIRQGKVYSPSVMKDDQLIAGIAAKLTELETQKSSLLADSTPAHPAVRNLTDQIVELQHKILSTYETALGNLTKQEDSYSALISRYGAQIKKLPGAEMELAKLMLHTKVNGDIYSALLQKQQEARIAKASTISNINVIDSAIVPDEPVKPKEFIYLLLGVFGGMMLGIFFAFFAEYLDDTIKDPEVARRELGLPPLAAVPYISQSGVNGKGKMLITYNDPKSAVAEVFRSLRTSIHFTSINARKQVILMTSSFPGEGKTTIMGNYAVSIAQLGARVLLIDCDLRRSALHTAFGHSKTPGLTDVLAGDADFRELVRDTGIDGIDFISAGTTPPNPAELLGSERMRLFLEEARVAYDYILLDSPPILAVTDAHLLATMSDTILMVLETGRVPVKTARRMQEILTSIGTPVAGIIINDKSRSGQGLYGYGRYKYYGYGYYGEKYGEDVERTERWLNRLLKR